MALVALDHINIYTDRLAETRDFFIAVLNLQEGDRPDFGVPGHWLYLADHPVVHLVGTETGRRPSSEAALDHFAFRIDDYDAAIARLDKHGLDYRVAPVPGRSNVQIFLRDPNGVAIELNFPG